MSDRESQGENGSGDVPDFLIKSSFGCSVVAALILLPFTVAHFIYDRNQLGMATGAVTLALCFNIRLGLSGRYSSALNTFLVVPGATVAVWYTMLEFGSAGSYWPFLLTLCFYYMLPERRALTFNLAILAVTIPTAWILLDRYHAVRFSAALFGVSLFSYISVREMNRLHGLLRERAVTDALTGLHNRGLLELTLEQAIAQQRRAGVAMTLLSLDIDDFKEVNDSLGHDAGDQALRNLGGLLRRRTRNGDMAFRLGGEEFLVLLHNTDAPNGAKVAEDFRALVERSVLVPDRVVTVSVGVSELEENMDTEDWLKASDEKLYAAKEAGRNRVVV